MITIHKVNESFISLEGYTYEQSKMLSEEFSFFVNGFQFIPSYKSGFWDGKIRLFNYKNGQMNIGLLYALKKFLKKSGIDYKTSKELRPIPLPEYTEPFIDNYFTNVIKWDHNLRPDQIKSIYYALKYNKLVIESPTGSGKSLILFMIIELLKRHLTASKTLLIVPTTSLVEQMRTDFMDYARNYQNYADYIHTIYSGKEKITDKDLIISTWQSMKNMPAKYFEQFDILLIDEAHGINEKSKEVQKIVNSCINAKFKIGDTGTIGEGALNKMVLEGLFGQIYKASSTKELIDKGILTALDIKMILLNYNAEDCKNCGQHREVQVSMTRKKKVPMTYNEEISFIREHEGRLDIVLDTIKQIPKGDNTLVMFKSLAYGKKIYDRLCSETNKKVFYVAGSTNVKVREEIRKYCENSSNVVIVASEGVFAVGINIKRLHNIVFTEASKSKIRTLQKIGRSLRLHDTKAKAVLYDIVDNLTYRKRRNFTMEHCLERISIYEREKFKTSTKEIDLI